MDNHQYFVGVDGGGSGCRARLVDEDGRILGEGESGPANLAQGTQRAVDAILDAVGQAADAANLRRSTLSRIRAGLGLAGANSAPARAAFDKIALPFQSTRIVTDAEIACIGAHGGDGAIVIVGTGTHALMIADGVARSIGGWGFWLGDHGSGAALGHGAARLAMQASSGLVQSGPMTHAILTRFKGDPVCMMEWSLSASPRDWAALAPLVIDHAHAGDALAQSLLKNAVAETERLIDRVVELGAERVALMGGLAPIYGPLLSARLTPWMVMPKSDALDGALHVAGLRSSSDSLR